MTQATTAADVSPLKRAFLAIEKMQGELALINYKQHEPIAIIGMGCCYPGGAETPDHFWQQLLAGFDAVIELPAARAADLRQANLSSLASAAYGQRGGFLPQVDQFDPAFFGLAPREVVVMDPAQRLLLETTWQALEAAAIVPATLFNTEMGVFIGGGTSGYLKFCGDQQHDLYTATGNVESTAAGRISYLLGITGPCVAVDTACSSALTAIHLACQSLRTGECNAALAGGVNLLLDEAFTTMFANGNMLSTDAQCKTFDAAANGYVRGEGCGIIVLKRLSDALAAQDPIVAVIRGTALNQDGPSGGLTIPNGPSQAQVIRRALADANLQPAQIGYIEAHGTGTPLGDPIEMGALSAVFKERSTPLYVGSVKTNVGHLEMAAGIAGLMKLALALQNGTIPPHLHLHTPNPHIDWATSPVQVPTTITPWLRPGDGERIGGVSSFGFSGTNAHVILAEAPQGDRETGRQGDRETGRQDDKMTGRESAARSFHLFTLSAKQESVLPAYAQRYLDFLAHHPELDLGDLCYTSHVGRSHYGHRLSFVAPSVAALQEQLAAYLATDNPVGHSHGTVPPMAAAPKIAFLFTGQGAQYVDMGRELYATNPQFRATLDHCDELLRTELNSADAPSLLSVLYPETGDTHHASRITLDDTTYTQPALFVLEYALATLWQSWGIQPNLLLGHSIGELVAACVAGVFSLADGLKLVAARGRLMGALPQDGAMVSLTATEAQVQAAIAPYAAVVSIAAVNGPESVVISGKRETVLAIADQLAATGVKTRQLTVSHAFHSGLMELMLAAFRTVAGSITYHTPKIKVVANVTGKLAGAEITTPDYWVRHVREAVRFGDGVATLAQQGIDICLEIGPKPVLLGMAGQVFDQLPGAPPLLLPSLREGQDDWLPLLTSLGELYVRGVAIDWASLDQDAQRRRIALPTYPFQRQRYWVEPTAAVTASDAGQPGFAQWLATHTIEQLTALVLQRGEFDAAAQPTVAKVLSTLAAEQHAQGLTAQVEALLYDVAWVAQPLALPVPPATIGRWLILADAGGVGAALAAQLTERGEQVDLLSAARATTAVDWSALINPPAAVLPLRGIIHLWAFDTGITDEPSAWLQSQQHNLASALQIVQTLAASDNNARLWIITQGAQQLAATEAVAQTGLWGLGRVIALEHSALWGGLVDVDSTAAPEVCAAALAAEILQGSATGESQVAYRQGTRYVARLVRHTCEKVTQPALTIDTAATYLITGGLGALGLLVAEWLVTQGAKQLLLIGRRGITTGTQQTVVDQLTAKGIKVEITQVDVADEAAMRALFAQLAADAVRLKGVFHTAGVLDDGLLRNQQWARFAPVLAPKVTGGWLLHQLTAAHDLDFMVFFSSATALLGNPGQGNYAAANAFLDGLARYRQQQGLPTLSINWGAWAEVGMAARTGHSAAAGEQLLAPTLGIAALAYLLSRGQRGQLGVLPIDWSQVTEATPFYANFVTPVAITTAPTTLVAELTSLPPSRRLAQLQSHLQKVVGRVLGMRELPFPTTGFADLGMDSLMALELRRQLERDLHRVLPTTIAFEYPTVDKLATYLLDEVLALAEAQSADLSISVPARPIGLDEPIAVISMACRFPGADTPEAFWQLLQDGADLVQPIPAARWPVADYYDPQRPLPGKMYTQAAAFIDAVDQFDPLFFGIAPREAVGMDPQQRLLLELGWEALERAGLAQQTLVDSPTGVFVGIGEGEYGLLHGDAVTALDTYAATGSGHSVAAGRLAYTLGLQGPTLAVDTACSSSLVAIHLACQSLRLGECDLALAGGVNLMLSPTSHIALSQMQALAADGRCKTFAAAADGYGRGEGGGMVLLKRLGDAERDGDQVLAVIKGSAVNHDGPSSGLTVPNKLAQEKLLRQALAAAQVTPDAVAYIEAHGTGTPLGDPIELRALHTVFGAQRLQPLLVGSVKTNIGHLEAAAGIAGFIKTVLALQHKQIPSHLHFDEPSPHFAWNELALTVPTTLQPWPDAPYVAGVSAFGLSGTNAHVIVAAAEGDQETRDRGHEPAGVDRTLYLLTLSAKSEGALVALAQRYAAHLQAQPDLDLGDLCYSAAMGRNRFDQRLAIVTSDHADLQAKLTMLAQGESAAGVLRGVATTQPQRIAFLFTGQGAQYVDMGRELYVTEPTFRATIDRCDELLRTELGPTVAPSLLAVIYPETRDTRLESRDTNHESRITLDDTTYTQPALFALEYALATLWQSWGIQPDLLIGHSIGELAAACVAGVFSLEDGLKLVAARGRLMGALPQDGTMVSLMATEAQVQTAIAPYAAEVSIAAVNGPESVVISGKREAVLAIADQFAATGVKTRQLNVSHAFHSPLMEPMLDAFRAVAESITYHAPKLGLVSNVTGKLAGAEMTTPDYWVRHVRDAVRFGDGITALAQQGVDIFLEIGPKAVLLGMAGQILDQLPGAPQLLLPSLRDGQDDWQPMLTSLGELYVRGVASDWVGFDQAYERCKVSLPTYPFQRQRYWLAAKAEHSQASKAQAGLADWLDTYSIEALTDLVAQRGAFAASARATVNQVLTTLESARRAQAMQTAIAELLYDIVWQASLPIFPHAPMTPGRWLLLGAANGVGDALAARLTALGEMVEIVSVVDSPAALDGATLLNPAGELKPLRGVVHLWALDCVITDGLTDLVVYQQRTLASALQLVQQLAAKEHGSRLWIVTQGAQQLAATESVALAQTGLWGLGRVIALEHNELWGGLVDLDPTATPAAGAEALVAEILHAADSETQVAYRQGTRHVARLVHVERPNGDQPSVLIHPDACYLITGGLGALGLLVAEWLSTQGASKLILLGRRGITTASQQTVVDQLTAKGIKVEIAQVDVADEAAMRSLFAQLAADEVQLKGVFHTAGVLDDGLLRNQRPDRFAPVLAPKVTGGWLLHQLTAAHDLDFMIFFSSATALLGNPGQGNYAAANAFLDGLARYRQQQGFPTLSINWGAWAEVGMAARTGHGVATGDQLLSPALGIAALAYLLAHEQRGQLGVLPIDWSQVTNAGPFYANFVTPVASTTSQATLVTELVALPSSRRLAQLQGHLQKVLGRVLGMRELPFPTTGFADLGMDSLMALELRRQLERDLHRALPTTVAFEYPTVDKLATYLLDEVLALAEAQSVDLSIAVQARPLGLDEPIAVISMACRFPGADTPEAFWQLLQDGADLVQSIPAARWPVADYYAPQRPLPGKMYTQAGAFIDGVDQFDPLFFGIAPREALGMDPQHRLLLEISWEALERAGLAQQTLVDSPTGVFIGIGEGEYGLLHGDAVTALDTYAATGSGHSVAAGRLAYTLGLQGPTLAVDTACSSSLVALHLACQSLRLGECDLALAGGVNLMLSPTSHIALSQMQALAADGRCKTFAAAADGYGRGEGGGMVLLKRLGDAERDGDTILAFIKGSAVNHDGPSSGLTVPNRLAQEKLLRQALAAAQVTPGAVAYIEAHGTGTPLGDPIELRALQAVFGGERSQPLLVSSVKTNIGHLEAAAGIAGFIKTVLALQHKQIPSHLHFDEPSPHLVWDQLALRVPTALQPWPDAPYVAGVSAFGLSGTNAHVIVAAAEGDQETRDKETRDRGHETAGADRTLYLLTLSAKSEEALVALAQRYAAHLQTNPDVDLGDLCYSAAVGRNSFDQRLALVASDHADLAAILPTLQRGENGPGILWGTAAAQPQRIAFLFTGQGAQYVNMGRELYVTEPTFRATIDRCDELLREELGSADVPSLLAVMYPETQDTRLETRDTRLESRDTNHESRITLDDTTYTQPALFALEYALATLWQSWGIQPDLLVGHSIGELAAACMAGVFSLEDGLKLVTARGRLMGALPQDGAMASLVATEAQVQAAIAAYSQEVSIAAVNGPESVVISGKREAVLAIADQLAATGVKTRQLTVSHAFHSGLMEPMLESFREVAASITYHEPKLGLVSNVTGKLAGVEMTTPDYWVRHVREAVRFGDGVATLAQQGIDICLEIGPKPVLLGMAGQILDQLPGTPPLLLPSLRDGQADWQPLLTSLGELYVRGHKIDWAAVDGGAGRRKIALPTYPFQRQRYWLDPVASRRSADHLGPLLDKMVRLPATQETLFETAMSAAALPILRDHRVDGTIVAPGAAQLAMVLSAATIALTPAGSAGQCYLLRDVIFPQALVIGDDEIRTAQILLTPDQAGQAERQANFQLRSFADPTTVTAIATTLHAQGTVAVNTIAPLTGPTLRDLQARYTVPVDERTLNPNDALPLVFGPAFRWIAAAWHEAENERTVLTQLRQPAVITDLAGYPLHPGLLDGCFQTPGLLPLFAQQTAGALYLPFAVASMALMPTRNGAAMAESWWCFTEQVGENQWNLRLFDDQGQLLAEILGFALRATSPSAIQPSQLRTEWLHRLAWQATPLPTPTVLTSFPDCWLVVGQAAGLCAQLETSARPVFTATTDESVRQVIAEIGVQQRSVGVIYVGLPIAAPVPTQTYDFCAGLLHLTQALLDTTLAAQLWLVTQGTQQPVPTAAITTVAAGALWGLGRTIAQEQPKLRTVCLDLDSDPDALAELLYQELVAGLSAEPVAAEVAYAQGTRYVAQLTQWTAPAVPTPNAPMRLQLQAYGALDQIVFVPLTRRSPGAGEVEIAVKAVGLNFRDVLNALGLLQEYYATVLGITSPQAVGLGFECAGVVTAVGPGVTELRVGERVMGLAAAEGAFASYLTLPATQLVAIPDHLGDEEGATLPLALLTAWYGLVVLAQLQPGESVLIHAAAGGVGQAAVQIAQAIGAEIIATASPGKWDFLRAQGITQILNSRTLDFGAEILELTGGRGVDVVLNSLNGDFIERSFAALGQGGRFVEIGKLGIWSQEKVAQSRPDVAYYPFDLGEALTGDATLQRRLWQDIMPALVAGQLRPLPQTVFPVQETVAAFRYMQQAKQVGKIVVTFAEPTPATLHTDASYLITGGLGALGLQLAQQLVADGARQLVLTGRHGVTTDGQRQVLAELAALGAHVKVIAADIGAAEAVQSLLDQCTALGPLRGIIHGAGVLDDGVLTAQTAARLAAVLRPKVDGAWHLHTLTQAVPLDFLVCFSSAAALVGSPGQSNYAAANAFLDTLMLQRRQQGLPGLSINWGPWAESGMAAKLATQMGAQGLTMISADQGRQLFRYLLDHAGQVGGQIGVLGLKRTQPQATPPGKREIGAELIALPTGERLPRLVSYLRTEIATVLGLRASDSLDARTRLFDIGMDSLMAVELRNRIEAGLRCSVRATLLFDYPTLEVLAPYLLDEVLKLPQARPAAKAVNANQNESSQRRTTAAQPTTHGPIAIIGMACHYPGGVDTPAAFWAQLVAGFDGIIELPANRAADLVNLTPGAETQTVYTARGGFLTGVDQFDPAFFGLSPREVVVMDPAHRLLLETAWQALEAANLVPAQLFNQEIGVFVGGGVSGYLPAGSEQSNIYAATGNTASTAAGRLSYVLGFTGPAMAIDTACSSALVAIHLACQSLRNGECEAALAGGVNLLLDQETTTIFASGNLLSADARCKTFDAAANGYVRGEGCGLIVLKRLADAEAAGDPICAVIRGTAINQDGPSSGLTVPNGPAQERVIRRALADADLTPAQIGYIEAHGTGTPLGDPIEIGALSTVFAQRATPLYVGSVKTNVGHLEAAAGVAGLMKLVLALQHRQLPPHLHLHHPNPHIDWAATPVQVPTVLTEWAAPADESLRIGGVSSFGFSGTNAHVIVAEYPPAVIGEVSSPETQGERPVHLLTLSAKTDSALQVYAEQYHAYLAAHPQIDLGDLCYAVQTGRSHFAQRLTVVAASTAELQSQLLAYTTGQRTQGVTLRPPADASRGTPKIAFLFTGQGAQYLQMGRELYLTAPVFRALIDRCDQVMQAVLGRSLVELIYPATEPHHNDLLTSHPCGQAVNFALECALADLWRSWGVQPTVVLGHSLGDFAAAYTAGLFSLEDGLGLVIERGRLMEQALGSMVSVMAAEAEVAPWLVDFADVTIGVINGPKSVVLSGGQASVTALTAQLQAAGFKTRKLDIPVAAHSPMLDPVLADFEMAVRQLKLTPPQLPVVSSMTGQLVADELTDPSYWRQHLRNTVRFADGLTTLAAQGVDIFIEIGPKPVLLGIAEQTFDELSSQQADKLRDDQQDDHLVITRREYSLVALSSSQLVMLPSLRENQSDWRQMLASLGELYVHGVAIDWAAVDHGRTARADARRQLALPTYPFQRQRYWIDAPKQGAGGRGGKLHPLLDTMTKVPRHQETIFETAFSVENLPFLADHLVYGTVISPGACQLALVLSGAALTVAPEQTTAGHNGSGLPAKVLQLADVILPQALVLPDGATRTVQTILTGQGKAGRTEHATRYEFEVISFAQADGATEPAIHATGTVTVAQVDDHSVTTPDLASLRQQCTQAVDLAAFYQTMAAAQIEFGPSFRWLAEAWQGDMDGAPAALARLALPPGLPTPTDQLLHPGLLDGCFQVAGLARGGQADPETMLPFAVEALTLYVTQPTAAEQWWCYASQRAPQQWEIHLLDEQGQPVALIQGYTVRSAPAEAVRGADLWREWLYQIDWQPRPYVGLPPDYLPHPAHSAAACRALLPALWTALGGASYQGLFEGLEALSLTYILGAFAEVGFTFHPGSVWQSSQLAQRAGVIPSYRRLFQRLLTILAEAGILRQADGQWQVVRTPAAVNPAADLARLQTNYGDAPELHLLRRCGEQLSTVLRGSQEPLELLFADADSTATALYSDSPGAQLMNKLIAQIVMQALAALPAERQISILEIGAGTGGATVGLLPLLPSDRTDYRFTDIGPTFLTKAQARFAAYEFVRYQPLDIEQSPVPQGFAPGQADLLIAANVLHATKDLAVTLRHVRELLQPGGQLILLEGTVPSRWVDLTFGLTDGWWRFADTRQDHPLLTARQWQDLLQAHGFLVVEIIEHEGQAIIIAQAAIAPNAVTAPVEVPAHKPWLIFADAQGIGVALAAQLQQRGEAALLVYPGPAYDAGDGQICHLQPTCAADYQRLLATYPGYQGIVYLWGLDLGAPTAETNLVTASEVGCGAALHLVQALLKANLTTAGLWLVTQDAQAITAGATVHGFGQATLWGMGRVIAQEHPELGCVCVDLAGAPVAPALSAAQLCAEVRATRSGREQQVALRAEARYVARLATFVPAPRPPIVCQPDATYLITGGLGGIGLATAAWLVAQGAQHLVLLGRSRPKPEAQRQVDALLAQGVTVTVAQCDVTDRAQLETVLAGIDAAYPLRGIIHSVGLLDDGALLQQSWARFATVLAPKLQGAWHLHTLTSGLELDFFVLYSSVAGLLGSEGQANHAAANAFLDAFAHYRQGQQKPALSINWGAWAEIGAAAPLVNERTLAARGYGLITPKQGLAALAGLLSQAVGQIGVVPIDWRKLQGSNLLDQMFYANFFAKAPTMADTAGLAGKTQASATSQPTIRQQLASAPPDQVAALLTTYLQQEVAHILQMSGLPNPASGFHEMGMDSLMTIELRRRLEKGLGVALPATIVFEYPTVALLRQYLLQEALSSVIGTPQTPPAMPPKAEPAGEAATADLETLSDAELSALLAQELSLLEE